MSCLDRVFEQKGTGIGELYSLVTKILGFGAGEEGKTMGLAPYGEPKYKKLIYEHLFVCVTRELTFRSLVLKIKPCTVSDKYIKE